MKADPQMIAAVRLVQAKFSLWVHLSLNPRLDPEMLALLDNDPAIPLGFDLAAWWRKRQGAA